MNNLFPYGNWVWVVISGETGERLEQNDGFIVAKTQEEAENILRKGLEREFSTPFEFDGDRFIATFKDGTNLYAYVEPLSCLNPEIMDG